MLVDRIGRGPGAVVEQDVSSPLTRKDSILRGASVTER